MSKSYVILWKSKINGRAGRGTKRFSLEEAATLVNELNREYPNIHHELLDSETPGLEQPESSAETNQSPVETSSENAKETHAFSE